MENENSTADASQKESMFGKLKSGWQSVVQTTSKTSKTLFEKGAQAKESMSERFAKLDVEACTLEEALNKIEADIFDSTAILEDLDDRFVGSARKIRDQVARSTAKMIYERWKDEAEKEDLKTLMELDYSDV
jgi:uncharacterized coiled-coil DUF342 family protein